MSRRYSEERHRVWASVLGGLAGLATWWGIFNLLFGLQPLDVQPARSEGKGGPIVEDMWRPGSNEDHAA
jgi:hypothetical protein